MKVNDIKSICYIINFRSLGFLIHLNDMFLYKNSTYLIKTMIIKI